MLGHMQGGEPSSLLDPLPPPTQKKKILIVAGPTAVGKTEISLVLAQALGGEILSADSVQVYRGMDIGTAKATPEQRALITHHLIDICDIDEPFNVAEFYKASQEIVREVFARQSVPIFVGGSGFYLHALLYGPPHGPSPHPLIRKSLEEQLEKLGIEALYERVQLLDPIYAATLAEKDRHKILRALEIMAVSEKKVSDFPKTTLLSQEYDFRCWFLHYPKEPLYRRLSDRCESMLQQGFLEEVRHLDALGLRNNRSASQAIGYRQALAFLDSPQEDSDYRHFQDEFYKASRHYTKRQFTWFRKEPLFRWIDLSQHSRETILEWILQDFERG